MSDKLLEVKNLSVEYDTEISSVYAVNGLDLDLNYGETLGLVGETGAGKTTTALSVIQLLPEGIGFETDGSIKLDGVDMLNAPEEKIRAMRGSVVSMIFQDPMTSLNPVYKIGKQVGEGLRLHRGYSKQEALKRATELLDLVGIPEPEKRVNEYPHQFSGGMRQRVMIAMALACDPDILIADEPTTALDVSIQAQIIELMQEMQEKNGNAIIMITHDLGVVASMCEKIAVMYAGHIVEYGTTDEIFYNPQHEYTKGLINSIPKLNAEEKERLVPIEGQPVDLLNPPAGSPFAPRCKSCMKVCLNKMPPRTELSDTHYTYCWLRQKEEFEKGGKA